MGGSLWGHKELETTEQLTLFFSCCAKAYKFDYKLNYKFDYICLSLLLLLFALED